MFLILFNTVMAQSVIDELENLDIDGAIRKRNTDDDDFDYVIYFHFAPLYHINIAI